MHRGRLGGGGGGGHGSNAIRGSDLGNYVIAPLRLHRSKGPPMGFEAPMRYLRRELYASPYVNSEACDADADDAVPCLSVYGPKRD